MTEQYKDLGRIIQSKDGDYWDIEIPDLDFATQYSLEVAWVFSDKTKGSSAFSDPYNFTTLNQEGLLAPQFREQDLDAINSILYVTWSGKDSSGENYLESILKQVNIWIKGGDFGEDYVQYAGSFTKAGTIQINATKVSTYCVKLQAESKSGDFSLFSNEFCITLLQQPDPVFEVRHEWVKRDLVLYWKFNVNLPKNSLADSFAVQLLANGKDITKYTSVDKSKIPPLENKIIFTESDLAAIFGQVTAFQTDYDAFIFVRDKNLQTSTVFGYDVSAYVDPLTPPVISVIKGPLSYNVSFTNNSEFDRIYIEDSIDSGVTWIDRGSSPSNPVYVSSGNSMPRQVRTRFSKIRGGLTGYSNIVNVTPDPLVSFNDEAPNKPTSFSGSGAVDSSGVIGFNGVINFTWTPDASSSNVRGYRIRFRPYKATAPFEEFSYVDSPGTGTKYRLSGLAVGTTYEIAVGSFNEFNKESVSYTSGTNVLVPGTPFIGTNVTTTGYFEAFPGSGNTSNAFRFGYGVESGKRGITFNENNYWYIDSNASALFKLGGDNENYIQWNGQTFIIQGDLRAKKGNFSGSVEIISGGSLFSGVMNQSQSGITGAGFILNNTGLKFSSSTISDITTISGTTGRFVTSSAEIGGWNVGTSTISSSGITLTSGSTPGATSIIAGNAGGYVGIKPKATVGSDVVLWAGTTSAPGPNDGSGVPRAGFQVNADGQLYATGAIISGRFEVQSGSSLGGLLNDTSRIHAQNDEPTGGTYKTGDAWVDTNDSNKLYIYNSAIVAPASKWVLAQDSAGARDVANAKRIIVSATQLLSPLRPNFTPSNGVSFTAGDAWYNTSDGNKLYIYNGSAWILTQDSGVADGIAAKASLKARLNDGVNLELLKSLIVNTDGAHIYSSFSDANNVIRTKDSYDEDSIPGFFIGWHKPIGQGKIWPAMNIGTGSSYLKFSSHTGVLEVKGTIKATSGAFEGDVTAGNISIGPTGIRHPKFNINSDGSANFSGTLEAGTILSEGQITGSTISGGTVTAGTTNGYATGFGNIKLNGATRTMEFLNSGGTVIGRMFSWADNETIIAPGGDTGYPVSSAFLSLAANMRTASLIVTGAQAQSIGELKLDSVHATYSGVSVYTTQGAPISTSSTYNANNGYYFRNIGMGTGAKATTDTDGLRGDIWIQYT